MLRLIVLKPEGPGLSFRERPRDFLFRSDTLSSALISILAQIGEAVDRPFGDGRPPLAKDPPFRVSSALPALRKGDGGAHLLFPVPEAVKRRFFGEADHKAIKRVLFASDEWLSAALKGERPKGGDVIAEEAPELVLRKWEDMDRDSGRTLLTLVSRTGLSVDRLTDGPVESFLFEVNDILVIADDFRIAILCECDENFWEKLWKAFIVLGLSGVGGKRTTGRGLFSVEGWHDFQSPFEGGDFFLTLSLYHPTEAEFGALKSSWYRLEERSGFVTSPPAMTLRRRRITMVSEGALIFGPNPPRGDVVCLLDPAKDDCPGLKHPVYRDGRPVSLRVPFVSR